MKGMGNNEEVQIATVNTDAGMYQRVRIEVSISATTLSATNLPTGLPSTLLAALSATIQLPALLTPAPAARHVLNLHNKDRKRGLK